MILQRLIRVQAALLAFTLTALSIVHARADGVVPPSTPESVPFSGSSSETADFGWRFILSNQDEPPNGQAVSSMAFDDAKWSRVDLPHDWCIRERRSASAPSKGPGGFFQTGLGWYRKVFDAPEEWRGRHVTLGFDGVYKNAAVWLNGSEIKSHLYGYTAFEADLSKQIKVGQRNVLAVCVDDSPQPGSRWYSGAGIFRPVTFNVTDSIHIPRFGGVFVHTPVAESDHAQVLVDVTVASDSPASKVVQVQSMVFDPDGKLLATGSAEVYPGAGGSSITTLCMNVSAPERWSPDAPHLYQLQTRLSIDGKIVDETKTPFGIRKLEFDGNRGLFLNDLPIKLRGGCIHNDDGPLGSAAFAAAEERKVRLHKQLGFNALRTAHNPPSSALLEACDRQGMLVMDELFDEWKWPKVAKGYASVFEQDWRQDVDSFVLRDRNHPSIILWSIGNEIPHQGTPEGGEVATQLARRVKEIDATRPITEGICSWSHSGPVDKSGTVISALDVIGLNYLLIRYPDLHAKYPGKPIVGTESMGPVAWYHWQEVEKNPWVLGDFIWPSMDYFGECTTFPNHVYGAGDLNLCGLPTPQAWYQRQVWGFDHDKLAIFAVPAKSLQPAGAWRWWNVRDSWTWPGQENQPMVVQIYSAHSKIELFVNGQSAGFGRRVDASNLSLQYDYSGTGWKNSLVKDLPGAEHMLPLLHEFTVPYQPGKVEAIAYDDGGKSAAHAVLTTAGPAAKLRLVPETQTLRANGQDLLYVNVEITDLEGNLDPNAANNIRLSVDGQAAIQGMANDDGNNTELYAGQSEHLAHHGRLLVVLRATRTAGPINFTVTADGLDTAALDVQSQADETAP